MSKKNIKKTKSIQKLDEEEKTIKTETKKLLDYSVFLNTLEYETPHAPNPPKAFDDDFFQDLKENQPETEKIDEGILLEGWLIKEGRLVKSWKKRWFVLTKNKLSYYATKEKTKLKGEVVIETCTIALSAEKKNCLVLTNMAIKETEKIKEDDEEVWFYLKKGFKTTLF
jgi:hypothetical protein